MGNLLTIAQLKSLCAQMNIRPHRRKGQHFLVDSRITRMMADAADLSKKDTVLEIGPGFGILTEELLARAGKVIAVENDRRLVGYLKEKFAKEIVDGRLELIEGDILRFQILDLRFKISKVVSNIPYSITSEIVTMFLGAAEGRSLDRLGMTKPKFLVLMIQKEVAERITAVPPHMSRLAVFVQFHAEVEEIAKVPRTLFWPEPEVDSAIVLMRPYPVILSGAEGGVERSHHTHPMYKGRSFDSPDARSGSLRMTEEARSFMCKLVAAGFAHPRKQLYRQIAHLFCASMGAGTAENKKLSGLPRPGEAAKEILASCGISPTARPGELSIEQWIMLAQHRSH